MANYNVTHNTAQLRFEVEQDGEIAYIDYRYYKKDIAFMHAFVPVPMRGKGIADELAKTALEFAKAEAKSVMMYCPFVSKYVRAHPEYHSLVDKDYHPGFK